MITLIKPKDSAFSVRIYLPHQESHWMRLHLDISGADSAFSRLYALVLKGYIKHIVIISQGLLLDAMRLLLQLPLLVSHLLLLPVGGHLHPKRCVGHSAGKASLSYQPTTLTLYGPLD